MKLSKISIYLLSIFIMAVGAYTIISSEKASALTPSNYSNYLIDDAVMRDSTTETQASIQQFLVNQGSGLAGFNDVQNCGSPAGAHYAHYSAYYSCGALVPASKIIYDAGRAYGINPRVLLATMQKEQSLVSTPNPTASQLTYAMGYGCPDSGGCSYPGFFNQVDNAAWQFRVNMELSSGNSYWGYGPASYPCNGATRYYSQALKAGRDVTFIDDNNVSYNRFVIPNAATASLYCYTPHVYNNPLGLYLKPAYGTVGMYYSGSYNFVDAFVRWFGSTYIPQFQARYHSQGSYPTLLSGERTTTFIRYQNTGNKPWYDDVTAPQYQTYPVHLATANPANTPSPFSIGWPTNNRATGTFAKVFESDGVTLAANQHVANPGQIVEFEFPLTAPGNLSPGYYQAFFQPILEGSVMWNMGGVAWTGVTVQPMLFQAGFSGQSTYPSINRGQSAAAYFKYKNIGNMPWYDDVSAAQYGTYPVHLATTNPINRPSTFSDGWPTNNRASGTFAKVFESDGVTLAPNQHVASPGQIVEFDFTFTVPSNMQAGFYQEHFQLVLEGSVFWNMGGVAWLGVSVN